MVKSEPETVQKVSDLMQGPPKRPPKKCRIDETPSLKGVSITEDIFEASCLIFNQALNCGGAGGNGSGSRALKMLLVWKIFKWIFIDREYWQNTPLRAATHSGGSNEPNRGLACFGLDSLELTCRVDCGRRKQQCLPALPPTRYFPEDGNESQIQWPGFCATWRDA